MSICPKPLVCRFYCLLRRTKLPLCYPPPLHSHQSSDDNRTVARHTTHRLSYGSRFLPIKAISALALSLLAIPCHSVWLDSPEVKDGLSLLFWGSVNPKIGAESNRFTYLGDPKIYPQSTSVADILADKDRQDSDRRARLSGTSTASLQLFARQVLTKDVSIAGGTLLSFNTNSGEVIAPWGISAEFNNIGDITVGDNWTRLDGSQTEADNLLQERGRHIGLSYEQIAGLNVRAYHMFNATSDTRDHKAAGWHKSNGASISYRYDFAPRKELIVAVGATKSKGHDSPFYVSSPKTGKAMQVSTSYQHNDLKLAFDVGQKQQVFNGILNDKLKTTSWGVKADYEITPRLSTSLHYSRLQDNNSKPLSIDDFVRRRFQADEERFFAKRIQERYGTTLDYQLNKGISLSGTVENTKTINYLSDGPFSKRNQLQYNAGIRFAFN